MAAAGERIGTWTAVSVPEPPGRSAVGCHPDRLVDRPQSRRPERRRGERSRGFGTAVLIGTIPLIAAIAGSVGYLIAGGGGGQSVSATGDQGRVTALGAPSTDGTTDGSSTAAGPATSQPPAPTEAAAPPGQSSPSGDAAPLASEPEVEVVDGTVRIVGRLPAAAVIAYRRAYAELADALGYELVDDTIIDEGAAVPSRIPTAFRDAVFFAPGSDGLDPAWYPMLDAIADYLRSASTGLTIVSHTDSSGSAAENLHLAQHRAGEVFNYLVARGVEPGRISIDPRGESESSGATGPDAAAERRVEFIFDVEH